MKKEVSGGMEEELDEKLQAAQQGQDDKKYQELENRIAQLEKEKKELEEITKRSQYEYVNLKTDFDRYQRQVKESSDSMQVDSLLSVVKKFLPFIEDLRKSLENLTDEHMEDPLTKGVQMVYNKFLKTLEHLHIKSIESLGLTPDSFLHEPVSVEPVTDEKFKGKIIKEFERGFVYIKGDDKRVIIASKVIVGQ
ncbi:MAG: nucleotide exchange factor GrpE [candidate division SR1 bacterium]|nr:nucleotide exchange factor GrpE [candidate division SR1 bacterium]